MVIGLQFFKSLRPDGTPGKSQATDPGTAQPLSFGEILKRTEEPRQPEQVTTCLITTALAALQTQSMAVPLLLKKMEGIDPGLSAEETSQPAVAAANLVTQALPPKPQPDPVPEQASPPDMQTPVSFSDMNAISKGGAEPETAPVQAVMQEKKFVDAILREKPVRTTAAERDLNVDAQPADAPSMCLDNVQGIVQRSPVSIADRMVSANENTGAAVQKRTVSAFRPTEKDTAVKKKQSKAQTKAGNAAAEPQFQTTQPIMSPRPVSVDGADDPSIQQVAAASLDENVHQRTSNSLNREDIFSRSAANSSVASPSQPTAAATEDVKPERRDSKFIRPISSSTADASPSSQPPIDQEVQAVEIESFHTETNPAASSTEIPQGQSPVVQDREPLANDPVISGNDSRRNERVVPQVHQQLETTAAEIRQSPAKPAVHVDTAVIEKQAETKNNVEQSDVSAAPTVVRPVVSQLVHSGDGVEAVQNTTRDFTASVYEKIESDRPEPVDAMPVSKSDTVVTQAPASDRSRSGVQPGEQATVTIETAEPFLMPKVDFEVEKSDGPQAARVETSPAAPASLSPMAPSRSIESELQQVTMPGAEKTRAAQEVLSSQRMRTISVPQAGRTTEGTKSSIQTITTEPTRYDDEKPLSADGAFIPEGLEFASLSELKTAPKGPSVSRAVPQEVFTAEVEQPVAETVSRDHQAVLSAVDMPADPFVSEKVELPPKTEIEFVNEEPGLTRPQVFAAGQSGSDTAADANVADETFVRSTTEEFIAPRTKGENQSLSADLKVSAQVNTFEATVKEPVVSTATRPQTVSSAMDRAVRNAMGEISGLHQSDAAVSIEESASLAKTDVPTEEIATSPMTASLKTLTVDAEMGIAESVVPADTRPQVLSSVAVQPALNMKGETKEQVNKGRLSVDASTVDTSFASTANPEPVDEGSVLTRTAEMQRFDDRAASSVQAPAQEKRGASSGWNAVDETLAPENTEFVPLTKSDAPARLQSVSSGTDRAAQTTTGEATRQENKNGLPVQTTLSVGIKQESNGAAPDSKNIEDATDIGRSVRMAAGESAKQTHDPAVVDRTFASTPEVEPANNETTTTHMDGPQLVFSEKVSNMVSAQEAAGAVERRASSAAPDLNMVAVSQSTDLVPAAKAAFGIADSVAPEAVHSRIFSGNGDQSAQRVWGETVNQDAQRAQPVDAKILREVSSPENVQPASTVKTDARQSQSVTSAITIESGNKGLVTAQADARESLPESTDRPVADGQAFERPSVSEGKNSMEAAAVEFTANEFPAPTRVVPTSINAEPAMAKTGSVEAQTSFADTPQPARTMDSAQPENKEIFPAANVSDETGTAREMFVLRTDVEPATSSQVSANGVGRKEKSALPDAKSVREAVVPERMTFASNANAEVSVTHTVGSQTFSNSTDQPVQSTSMNTMRQEAQSVLPGARDEPPVLDDEPASTEVFEVEKQDFISPPATSQEILPGSTELPVQKMIRNAARPEVQTASSGMQTVIASPVPATRKSMAASETGFTVDEPAGSVAFGSPILVSDADRSDAKTAREDAGTRTVTEALAVPVAVRPPVSFGGTTPDLIGQRRNAMSSGAKVLDETFSAQKVQPAPTSEVETALAEPDAPIALHSQSLADNTDQPVQKVNGGTAEQNSQPVSLDVKVTEEMPDLQKAVPTIDSHVISHSSADVPSADVDRPAQKVTAKCTEKGNERATADVKVIREVPGSQKAAPVIDPPTPARPRVNVPPPAVDVVEDTFASESAEEGSAVSGTVHAAPRPAVKSQTNEQTPVEIETAKNTLLAEAAVAASARTIHSQTNNRPTSAANDLTGVNAREVDGTAERVASAAEDTLSANARRTEMSEVSVDGRAGMQTDGKVEAVSTNSRQIDFEAQKGETLPESVVASVSKNETATPEPAGLGTNAGQRVSHIGTIASDQMIVTPERTKTSAVDTPSATTYGNDVPQTESQPVVEQKRHPSIPHTTETVPQVSSAAGESTDHETSIRIDSPVASTVIVQTENDPMDGSAVDSKLIPVEGEEKPIAWHVPIAEMDEALPGTPDGSFARIVKGGDVEKTKLEPTGKEEKTHPAEKETEPSQTPGAAVQAAGPGKETKVVEFNGKMPGEQIPARAAEVTQQIVRQMKVNIKNGSTSMHLKLNPKELGAIDVDMVSNTQGIQVTFFAEQASTGRLLETQLNQLREALVDSGVQLSGLNIGQHNSHEQKGGAFGRDPNFAPFPRQESAERHEAGRETPVRRSIGPSGEVDYRI